MSVEFTKEEAAHIDKKMNDIIFDWAKKIINHIITQAKSNGVKKVYMNTLETTTANIKNEEKKEYFYERLPPIMGFTKESVELRGKGVEELWCYDLETVTASLRNMLIKVAANINLEDLPPNRQGLFISILGRKPFYTSEDVAKVVSILEKKKATQKKGISARFFYDWNSKDKYSGDQSFLYGYNGGLAETPVCMKMHSDLQNMINSDPVLRKFWSHILSFGGHYGNDTIGFALVCKYSKDIWVINEIQSDCLNNYLKLRSTALGWERKDDDKGGTTFEVLKDMLITNNRDKWISRIEVNEGLKNALLANPDLLHRLPDNNKDIDAWILDQKNNGGELSRHFASINFRQRIFSTY